MKQKTRLKSIALTPDFPITNAPKRSIHKARKQNKCGLSNVVSHSISQNAVGWACALSLRPVKGERWCQLSCVLADTQTHRPGFHIQKQCSVSDARWINTGGKVWFAAYVCICFCKLLMMCVFMHQYVCVLSTLRWAVSLSLADCSL